MCAWYSFLHHPAGSRRLHHVLRRLSCPKYLFQNALLEFGLSTHQNAVFDSGEPDRIIIDSWNNIHKYYEVENAFFIFDDNRITAYGSWSHSFLRIAKNNRWIMLTDRDEEKWEKYITIFIANGFYRNKAEFMKEHVSFAPYVKYPKVDHYVNEEKLSYYLDVITVDHDDYSYDQDGCFIACDYLNEHTTDKPLNITIDTSELEDPDEVMTNVFKYIYAINDRVINLWIK